jgi:glycosyltransferase involved in cell wall biosynthesis
MNVVLAQNVSLRGHLALSTYLRSVAAYLERLDGVNLRLVVQGPGAGPESVPEERIRYIEADTYSLRGNARYTWRLYRALRELDAAETIDVIHCIYPNSSVQAAALFKRFHSPGVKMVYDIRSPWIEASVERLSLGVEAAAYRGIAYGVESLLARSVDEFVFITPGLRDFYHERLSRAPEPSRIVPSGVDLELFTPGDPAPERERLGIAMDDTVLGYVGAITRERELDFPVRALAELRDETRRYWLVFVGDGDDRNRIEAVADDLGVGERVVFTGTVDYARVPGLISSFDVGLCHLPDILFFQRSFPMKVLEYAACGVPVVASRIRAHADIAADVPIILYEHDDPGDLARAMREKGGDTAVSPQRVRRYGWDRIAADFAACYEDAISARGHTTG